MARKRAEVRQKKKKFQSQAKNLTHFFFVTPKVYYPFHKRLQLAPPIRHTNPAHTVSFSVFKLNFSIIIPSTSRFFQVILSFRCNRQNPLHTSLVRHTGNMSTHLIVLGFIVLATFGDQHEPRRSPSPSFVHLLVSTLFSNISAYELYMFLICALRNICTYVTIHNCTLIKYHVLYTCKCTLIKYIFYQCAFACLLLKC